VTAPPIPQDPFSPLEEATLRAIAETGVVRTFPKNTVLIHEGDSGDALYIVLSGRVKVYASNAQGREFAIAFHGAGEYVGEMTLDGGVRSASVVTIDPTVCAVVHREQFREFILKNPDFALHLIEKLINRVRATTEESLRNLGVETIDLIQVHNLGDVPVQLGILKELKTAKRVRYIGVTSTSKAQYAELARVMRAEPLDFIGVDYAVDNRSAEDEILPLALERRIAVMVYVPFGRTRLFQRVGARPLPAWAADFDAASWAQFFLKYVLGHPAVTVVTPATSKAHHMLDNLGGGTGRIPDDAARKRMAAFVDALPGDSASSS